MMNRFLDTLELNTKPIRWLLLSSFSEYSSLGLCHFIKTYEVDETWNFQICIEFKPGDKWHCLDDVWGNKKEQIVVLKLGYEDQEPHLILFRKGCYQWKIKNRFLDMLGSNARPIRWLLFSSYSEYSSLRLCDFIKTCKVDEKLFRWCLRK